MARATNHSYKFGEAIHLQKAIRPLVQCLGKSGRFMVSRGLSVSWGCCVTGYRQHLALIESIVGGESGILHPSMRSVLYKLAFGGSDGLTVEKIYRSLLDRWECSTVSQLSNSIGAKTTLDFVKRAIAGDDAGVNPLGHLALIALAKAQLPVDAHCFGIAKAAVSESQGEVKVPVDILQGLRQALAVAGLPERMAESLGRGDSLTKIARAWRVPPPRLRRELSYVFDRDPLTLCSHTSDSATAELIKKNLNAMSIKLKEPVQSITVFEKDEHVLTVVQARSRNRAKVLHYLARGVKTRKQLHYKNSDVGDWCREHDAAWFDEVLPAIPQAQRKGVGRKKGSKNRVKNISVMPYQTAML